MSTLGHLIAQLDAKIEALEAERSVLQRTQRELEDLKSRAKKVTAMSPAVVWLKERGYPDVAIPGGPYGHGTRCMVKATTLYELAAARYAEGFAEGKCHKYPSEAAFKPRLAPAKFDALERYLLTGEELEVEDEEPVVVASPKRGSSRSSPRR